MFCFPKPHDIFELKVHHIPLPPGKYRSQVKVVVIDDDGFPEEAVLRSHEFNVKVFNDIDDIRMVEAYDVVMCDIQGVGRSLGSSYEGAHIISEIHKFYPAKILISFSGIKFDTTYNKFFSLCDFNYSKNIDKEDWPDKLDLAIQKLLDPIQQWIKIRTYLLDNDVGLYKVLQLENDYVKSILKKSSFSPAESLINSLGPHIKDIVVSLAKSAVFRMLTGVGK